MESKTQLDNVLNSVIEDITWHFVEDVVWKSEYVIEVSPSRCYRRLSLTMFSLVVSWGSGCGSHWEWSRRARWCCLLQRFATTGRIPQMIHTCVLLVDCKRWCPACRSGEGRASSGRKIEDRWRLSCHQEAGNFLNICICIYICICVCVCVCICIRICKIRYSVLAATGGSRLAIGREYIRHDMTFAFDDKGRCLAEKFNQSQSQPGMTIYTSHIQRQDIGNQMIELTSWVPLELW